MEQKNVSEKQTTKLKTMDLGIETNQCHGVDDLGHEVVFLQGERIPPAPGGIPEPGLVPDKEVDDERHRDVDEKLPGLVTAHRGIAEWFRRSNWQNEKTSDGVRVMSE